jgi:hypothetical protein
MDELEQFYHWYASNPGFLVPQDRAQDFIEGLTALTIHRSGPFQVQLVIVSPNIVIPTHTHPDVDSFEVFLRGMVFHLNGEVLVNEAQRDERTGVMPAAAFTSIRVRPSDPHGGHAGPSGGAFLSIQQWSREPTSVGDSWVGTHLGKSHESREGIAL